MRLPLRTARPRAATNAPAEELLGPAALELLADLGVAAAAEDAHQLASRLARGESRLFRAALYLSISASDEDELDDACARVRALCASQLLTCIPASFRPLEGWLSTLPLGLDR